MPIDLFAQQAEQKRKPRDLFAGKNFNIEYQNEENPSQKEPELSELIGNYLKKELKRDTAYGLSPLTTGFEEGLYGLFNLPHQAAKAIHPKLGEFISEAKPHNYMEDQGITDPNMIQNFARELSSYVPAMTLGSGSMVTKLGKGALKAERTLANMGRGLLEGEIHGSTTGDENRAKEGLDEGMINALIAGIPGRAGQAFRAIKTLPEKLGGHLGNLKGHFLEAHPEDLKKAFPVAQKHLKNLRELETTQWNAGTELSKEEDKIHAWNTLTGTEKRDISENIKNVLNAYPPSEIGKSNSINKLKNLYPEHFKGEKGHEALDAIVNSYNEKFRTPGKQKSTTFSSESGGDIINPIHQLEEPLKRDAFTGAPINRHPNEPVVIERTPIKKESITLKTNDSNAKLKNISEEFKPILNEKFSSFDKNELLESLTRKLGKLEAKSSVNKGAEEANKSSIAYLKGIIAKDVKNLNTYEDAMNFRRGLNQIYKKEVPREIQPSINTLDYIKKEFMNVLNKKMEGSPFMKAWEEANATTQHKEQLFHEKDLATGKKGKSAAGRLLEQINPRRPEILIEEFMPRKGETGIGSFKHLEEVLGGDKNLTRQMYKAKVYGHLFEQKIRGQKEKPEELASKFFQEYFNKLSPEQNRYLFTPHEQHTIEELYKFHKKYPDELSKNRVFQHFLKHTLGLPHLIPHIGAEAGRKFFGTLEGPKVQNAAKTLAAELRKSNNNNKEAQE